MDLYHIKIQKLFGQFDYDISLKKEEGITILTGPNGYGKTTILNIVYNFFKQNFYFYQKLAFEAIIFYFADDRYIVVKKQPSQNGSFMNVCFELKFKNKILENYIFNFEADKRLTETVNKSYIYFSEWYKDHTYLQNSETRESIEKKDFFSQIPQNSLDMLDGFPKKKEQIAQLLSFLSSVNVYIIKAQRIIKQLDIDERKGYYDEKPSFISTIQRYSKELMELIKQKQTDAFKTSQELDNSFVNRLMQNEKKISFDEFTERFSVLTKKQKQLNYFGITTSDIQIPEYKADKSDALSVCLDDIEIKTNFFNDLMAQIELFVTMINNKAFANKKINVNGEYGFKFTTDKGDDLDLTALSSGEQQEIIMLYDLLFKIQQNAIILIDEPEISLHVIWQKAFVKNMLSISKLRPSISFLIATHSPQIINGRWDITEDLYEMIHGKWDIENV
jgi:predicted ATP-binding protein involved in virulence